MNDTAPQQRAIAVDVGGTKLAGALVDARGGCTAARRTPTPGAGGEPGGADPGLVGTEAMVRSLHDAAAGGPEPVGVGIGLPEYVTPEGEVRSHEVIGWDEQPRERFSALGLPVTIESDVRAAALAESLLGSGVGHRVVVYVSVGTGISHCLVEDGQAYMGASGAAIAMGEVEVSTPDGAWALEGYASGAGLARRYSQRIQQPVPGAIDVVRAADDGDATAAQMLHRSGTALGDAIRSVVHLLDPAVVVLGGGLALGGGRYLDACVRRLERPVARATGGAPVPVHLAALGAEAGVVGAGLAALRAVGVAVSMPVRATRTPVTSIPR